MGWMKRDSAPSGSNAGSTTPSEPKMVRNESADGQVCWTDAASGGDKKKDGKK